MMSEQLWKGELEATQQIKFFETLLRASTDGIVITDAAQNIVLANEAFCALLGRRRRDVIETSLFVWLEQLDAGAAMRWAELEQCVYREGDCRDVEFQIQRAGGVRHISVNASPLEQVAGEESGVVISIWRDVTERVRAESQRDAVLEALRTSMEIQDAILSTTDVLLAYMDREFNFIAVNQAYADSGRRRREDFVGKNHFDLYPHAENEEIFGQVMETGEAQCFSARPFEHPDQPKRGTTWWDWSLIPLKDESGSARALILSVLDVTARVRAEEALQKTHDELEMRVEERTAELANANGALRESEERYRSLFEGVPIGLYRSTPQGRIIEANPALVEMLGYSNRESLLGVNVFDIHVDPEERRRVQTRLERKGVVRAAGIQLQRCDGAVIWAQDTVRAVQDAKGRALYYEGSLEDITERVQVEEKLKESEENLRSIFENMQDIYYKLDAHGKILAASPSAVELYKCNSLDDIVGKQASDFVYDVKDNEKLIKELQKKGYIKNYIIAHKRKNGESVFVETNTNLIFDDQGNLEGAVGVFRDISERLKAEEALRESEEKLHTLLNATTDVAFLVEPDGVFLAVNDALAKNLGRKKRRTCWQVYV